MVEYSPTVETLRSLASGATLNWNDEVESWLRSKLGEGDREEIAADLAARAEAFNKNNPKLNAALKIAGAVPTLVNPYMSALRAGKIATTGLSALNNPYVRASLVTAGEGAVLGAGTAKEGEKLEGAATGAAVGALTGPTVLAGTRLATAAGPYVSALAQSGSPRNLQNQVMLNQAASKVPHESAYDALQEKLLSSGITMQMTDDQVGSGKPQPQWIDETITDYLHKYLASAQSVEAHHNKDKLRPMQKDEQHRPIEKWLNKNFRNFLKKEENTVYDTSEDGMGTTQRWYRNEKAMPWLEEEPVEGSTPMAIETTAGTTHLREKYPWIKKLPDDTPLKYLSVNPEDSFNLTHLMIMMDYGLSTPDLPDDLKIKPNALPSMSVEDVYERVHKLDLYVKSPDKGDYEKNLELPTVVENTTLNLSSVNPTGRKIFSIGEKKGKPIDQAVGGKWIEIDKGGFTDYSPEELEKIARYEELDNLAYDRGRPTNLITEAENEELIEIERYMIDNPPVTECGRINEQGGWCIRNEEVEDNYLGKDKLQDVKNKINVMAGLEDFAPNNMTEWKLALDVLLDSTGRPHIQVHALKDDAGNVREILEVSPVENRFDMEGYDDQKSRQETYQENDPKYIKKMGRALIEYLNG